MNTPVEVSWFSALCDDDYEFLGVPDPALASSWEHCRDLVLRAERNGFDNILLPSGYALGIDTTAFAAAIAALTTRIRLLAAVRVGESWPPQLARQLATASAAHWIDRLGGVGVPCGVVRTVREALEGPGATAGGGVPPAAPGTVRLAPPQLDAHGVLIRAHHWSAFAHLPIPPEPPAPAP